MKQIMIRLRSNGPLTLLILVGALLGSGGMLGWLTYAKDRDPNRAVNLVVDNTPIQRTGQLAASFSEVVKAVTPSVVRINITQKAPARMVPNPLWERFFNEAPNQWRQPRGPQRSGPQRSGPQRSGLGSGVIISEDGYILTNNHVVADADEIQVELQDEGRSYRAELVGTDPKSDLAVLKINAAGLPYARIGDSDQTEIGDIVLAIGNPFGVGQTVTMGIVSATGRASMGLDYEDFIQTDAAINPGNSGGALVDIQGRLIGINTAILSKTGASQGIGFAIPTNLARNVMEDLIEHGHVTRGFLGVAIQDVTPELADYFDIDAKSGALVADVTPGSPADDGGLEVGDVIVQVNDKDIKDSRHLKLVIGDCDPHTDQDIRVLRDNRERTLIVELDAVDDGGPQMSQESSQADSEGALRGVMVSDLDRSARQQLQLPRSLKGALVQDVDQDSAAWRAGLRPGDVIREINRIPVRDADDAVSLTQSLEPDVTLLRIWRRGSTLFLAVDESHLG